MSRHVLRGVQRKKGRKKEIAFCLVLSIIWTHTTGKKTEWLTVFIDV